MVARGEAAGRVPAWVEPMLATPDRGRLPADPAWAYEYKLDGYRACVRIAADGTTVRTSRNGIDFTDEFADLAPVLGAALEGCNRLREFESSDRRWEGRFVMVNASLPDSNRALRHTLRTRLSWLGFRVTSSGTWISLRLEAEREAAELIDQLGIPGASSFVATPGAVGSFHEVVQRAWDLDAVAAEYESFIEEFGAMRPADGDEVAIALVRIVHRWRRFPFEDPMLPPEMQPRDWPGITARRLYSALVSLWRPSATTPARRPHGEGR